MTEAAAQPASSRVPRAHGLILLAAALLGFFSNVWNTPLFDLDEGAFSQATLEMLHDGNYLTTTLNGAPRYDKPILIYWLQGASVSLLGKSELALRLPSVLCAGVWMLAVWGFARRYAGGANAGLVAACAVALGLMSSIIGHAAIADALLDMLLALTFFDLYRHYDSGRRAPLLRAYLWMGLGFLAKGPVAILLPVLVSFAFYLSQRRLRDWLRAAFDPLGWPILLAVLAVWIVPLWSSGHIDFLQHFLMQHNVDRYGTTLQGHGGHIWYYLAWLPAIVLPFTALLAPALRPLFRGPRSALETYLLLWFAIVFVIFSLSSTQLPHYLLYGCTPLFVLFGLHHERAPRRGWLLLAPLILALLLAALPWVLPLIRIPPRRAFEAGIVGLAQQNLGLGYKLLAFANLALILGLLWWRDLPRWRALLVAGFAQGCVVWFGVVPVLAAAQQQPIRDAALKAKALGLPTVSYNTFLPSFSVYRGAVTPNRLPQPGELVFVRRDRIANLEKALHDARLITEYQGGGVALFLYPESAQ